MLPVIESIDKRSWEYKPGPWPAHPPRGVLGGWDLSFAWHHLSEHERAKRDASKRDASLAPVRAPVMAGGVYAMNREWFFASGGYDEGLEVWGIENVEMSIRVWTCGGQLLTLPCSRVGHVFRDTKPFSWPNRTGALTVLRNARRVAAVWMDEAEPLVINGGATADGSWGGDGGSAGRLLTRELAADPSIGERRALRERLECQPFRWYLEEIHAENHPPLPEGFRWTTVLDLDGRAV